jgi:hypothetical protein
MTDRAVEKFAAELRKWWSFDDRQMHTHSWHSREDFIERILPKLLAEHADGERMPTTKEG